VRYKEFEFHIQYRKYRKTSRGFNLCLGKSNKIERVSCRWILAEVKFKLTLKKSVQFLLTYMFDVRSCLGVPGGGSQFSHKSHGGSMHGLEEQSV